MDSLRSGASSSAFPAEFRSRWLGELNFAWPVQNELSLIAILISSIPIVCKFIEKEKFIRKEMIITSAGSQKLCKEKVFPESSWILIKFPFGESKLRSRL